MVELTVGYEGEEENNKKSDDAFNELKQIEETVHKNYETKGTENVKICGKYNINKIISDMNENYENFCNLMIEQTPSKLKRGYYRILRKFGMFNLDNALTMAITKLQKDYAKIESQQKNYETKINDAVKEIKNLNELQKQTTNVLADLEKSLENKDSFNTWLIERNIATAGKQFKEFYEESKRMKSYIEIYDTCIASLDARKKEMLFLKNVYNNMLDKKNNRLEDILNMPKDIEKLGEAYGKA